MLLVITLITDLMTGESQLSTGVVTDTTTLTLAIFALYLDDQHPGPAGPELSLTVAHSVWLLVLLSLTQNTRYTHQWVAQRAVGHFWVQSVTLYSIKTIANFRKKFKNKNVTQTHAKHLTQIHTVTIKSFLTFL